MSEIQNSKESTNGRWMKEQHQKFLIGLELYGKNWKKIQSVIGTRTGSQIRSHAQKFFLKVQKTLEPPAQQQKNFEEQHSLSHSTCEFEKPSEFSYFVQHIVRLSHNNNSFDFWITLVDHPPNKSVASDKLPKRKRSFVQFQNDQISDQDSQIHQKKQKLIVEPLK